MKRSVFCLIMLAGMLAIASGVALADHVDFAGTWTLDKSKVANLDPRISDVTLIITQEGVLLTVVNRFTLAGGSTQESKSTYKADGVAESTVVKAGPMAGPLTQKATWTDDGKTLTIDQERTITRDGQEMKLHIVNVWGLSEDGKTLTIDTTQESPMGTRKNHQVYNKK